MNPSECVKSQMFLTSADRPRQERSLVRFARRQKSPHLSLFEMPSMNRRLILNQLPWCCCYVNGVVRATSWLFLTMGKTGQGFLPPQTHPFSQHSPRVSSLHWQRQSHSNTLEPTAASTRLTGSPWRRSLSAESSTHVTLCFYHMMHFHTRVGFFFLSSRVIWEFMIHQSWRTDICSHRTPARTLWFTQRFESDARGCDMSCPHSCVCVLVDNNKEKCQSWAGSFLLNQNSSCLSHLEF